jgi:hypothetical protein
VAIITLRDVQVTRVFWEGKGAQVLERYKTQFGDKEQRYSIFFDEPHGLAEGALITVDGVLGVKIDEYQTKQGETKQGIAITVNKPQVRKVDSPVVAEKVGHAALNEVWPTVTPGGSVDESAPF